MKLQSFEGWKVYSFPADPQEQNQLKRVSSNKLKNDLKDCDGNIENHRSLLETFPADSPKKKNNLALHKNWSFLFIYWRTP